MQTATKGETLFPGSPPTRCDCGCGRRLGMSFVDGRLRGSTGMWGYFSPECYATLGSGFGVGRGAQWTKNDAGKFALVKVAPVVPAAI